MLCSLSAILSLSLLGSAAGLATSTSTNLDATMVQATRKCAQGDFMGAVQALQKHGSPVGYEHGKSLLRSCFTNTAGECTLGPTQCAWIQKCLKAEGPCQQVPIEETFAEIPGGTEALIEMMSTKFNITENTTHVEVPVSLLIETMNKANETAKEVQAMSLMEQTDKVQGAPVAGESHRRRQSSNKLAKEKAEAEWRAEVEKAKGGPIKARLHQWLGNRYADRMRFFRDFPEDSQRKWFYNIGALLFYALAGCATVFSGVQTTGFGNHQSPVYTHYAPLGIGQPGEYVGPVYKTDIVTASHEHTCTTGTKTFKKHVWENMYGRLGWPNAGAITGYLPRYPGNAGR